MSNEIRKNNDPILLGVDLGTSSCKVCAVDTRGGVLGSGSAPYPTHSPHAGWSEQDPNDWIAGVGEAVRHVADVLESSVSRVAGIGLSSAAHIGVLLDENDRPLRRAILWSDLRSAEQVVELEKQCGDEIFRISYQKVSTTWTLPHLLWVRQNEPEVWARVRRVLLSKDYLLAWLTGRSITDQASAVSAQLFDPRNQSWSDPLCELAGLEPSMLPEVVGPTEIAGKLTGQAAEALGLDSETTVVVGSLDSATETYGAGIARPGQCLLRLATAGGIHVVVPKPSPHEQLINYPHPIAPLWYSQAGTSSCASSVQWAMNNLCGESSASFEDWDRRAALASPGCDGLFFHPYLAGERCPYWDPHLRASFVGLSARHDTAHMARAVYEGTAYSIRDAFSVLEGMELSDDPFVAVGGGTRSKIWLRIIADVLARPIEAAETVDSAYGAALLAGVGLEIFPDLERAPSLGNESKSKIEPDDENIAFYDREFERYRDIQARLASFYSPRE
jgi:xylulokinase